MIKVTPRQLSEVEQQLRDAQAQSHFVIFESYDPNTGGTIRLITDYQSYQVMKRQRNAQTPLRIVRDIVPVNRDLAMWAISENAAVLGNTNRYKDEIEYYINRVLRNNKLPVNSY